MLKSNSVNKSLWTMFVAVLVIAGSIPVMGAKLPVSKTEEQQALEDKEAQEQAVSVDESVPSPEEIAIQNLPEDTTPRYNISQITFSGNILFTDEQLLEDMPDIYNTAKDGSIDSANLYDLRGLKAIATVPGTEQTVSARSIQGFTQYILSVYQRQNYAGIYVYVPGEAFDANGSLEQGILPVQILEASVSNVSWAYYDPNNQSVEDGYLDPNALLGWSPVKEGRVMNRKKLDDYINLLNLNPDRYVSAVVSKGTEPNSLAVKYNVYEANPWHYFVQVDNSGTDDIQWRPRFGLINTNLLGFDDKFTAIYQTTPDSTWDEDYAIYGAYDFPIAGPKLRLNLFGGYNEFDITDPDLNFLGSGKFAGGTLRYNAVQLDDWFFDVTGTIQYEESKSSPDLPFPDFDSNIHMALWGVGADLYKTTDMTDTFLGFSMLSPFNSSDQAEMTLARGSGTVDDRFHVYYFNARHSRYLDVDKIQRASASFRFITSDDRLVPSKMTSFGGMYTIRGYDESEIVADGGIITSLQYEYDLVRKGQIELFGQEVDEKERKPFLKKLAPLVFLDYGQARIKDATATEETDEELCSVGGGIITELGDNFTGTVYYGYPLIATDDTRSGKGRVHAGFLLRW
ncbi:MAG: ShlB/FhaC/HecB family hemolysin secretion/activation protein [Planctomycetota bacterium]